MHNWIIDENSNSNIDYICTICGLKAFICNTCEEFIIKNKT